MSKAAKARAARQPLPPYAGTMAAAMHDAGMVGPSWDAWYTLWKVIGGASLSEAERDVFARCTGRQRVPAGPVRELALVCGRRAGKSRNLAALAVWQAVRRDYAPLLADGERAVVAVVAADRRQAGQVLAYVRGMCRRPAFAPYLRRSLKDRLEFSTGCDVQVMTASHATVRGYSLAAALADEVAFWATDEGAASPDVEVLNALRPGLGNLPDTLLVMSSTPYASRGELFKAHQRAYGREDADTALVWQASSADMNPTLDPAVIEQAYRDDPAAARAEWGGEFRTDVAALFDAAALAAVVVRERRERPPEPGVRYTAFVDPSGGSSDAFTLAVAHVAEGRAVLDVVRERRPPFSPEDVVREYAALLKAYGPQAVTGDAYGGQWPREVFARHGITYTTSARNKSALYGALLPIVNAGRCVLLDHGRLLGQLAGLMRRTAWGGRDSIDHGPGAHDDIANVCAGAIVTALDAGRDLPELDGFASVNRELEQASYPRLLSEDGQHLVPWRVPG